MNYEVVNLSLCFILSCVLTISTRTVDAANNCFYEAPYTFRLDEQVWAPSIFPVIGASASRTLVVDPSAGDQNSMICTPSICIYKALATKIQQTKGTT